MWVSVHARVCVRARTGMQTREEHVSATGWWERCPRTPPVKRQEPSQFGRRQKEKKENRAAAGGQGELRDGAALSGEVA